MTHSFEGTTRPPVPAKGAFRRSASASRAIAAACALALAVGLAACSGSSTSASTTSKPAAAQTASKSASNQTVVTVTDSATWGPILTLSNKDTIYRLTADSTNKSVCNGACLVAWPPVVLATGQRTPIGSGVTGLGTIRRSNGKLQVTYQGIPLYLFIGDHAPGEVNGNIKDTWGQWWVVNPAHPLVTPSPVMNHHNAAATPTTASTAPSTNPTTATTSPAATATTSAPTPTTAQTTPTTSAPTPSTQPTPTTKPKAPSSGGGGVSY